MLNFNLTDDFLTFVLVIFGSAGGTFALYSLLCRHMRIENLSARDADSSGVSDSEGQEKQSRLGKIFKKSVVARRVLLFISILGMCMLIGDGVLTPAISGLISSNIIYILVLLSCFLD